MPAVALQPLLTRHEVASLLNLSVVTLWRLAITDQLRPLKIGRRTLYRPDDINAFLLNARLRSGNKPAKDGNPRRAQRQAVRP